MEHARDSPEKPCGACSRFGRIIYDRLNAQMIKALIVNFEHLRKLSHRQQLIMKTNRTQHIGSTPPSHQYGERYRQRQHLRSNPFSNRFSPTNTCHCHYATITDTDSIKPTTQKLHSKSIEKEGGRRRKEGGEERGEEDSRGRGREERK